MWSRGASVIRKAAQVTSYMFSGAALYRAAPALFP